MFALYNRWTTLLYIFKLLSCLYNLSVVSSSSSTKNDLKDPKTIALLVKDGRYSTSYLPSGVYAEIREASVCRDQIMKQHVRLPNQIQGWLQKFLQECSLAMTKQSEAAKTFFIGHDPGKEQKRHPTMGRLDEGI